MAKFCTKCGKPLALGQVCDCKDSQNAQSLNFNNVQPYHQLNQPTEMVDVSESQHKEQTGISIRLPSIQIPTFDTSSPSNFWASILNNMGIGDPVTNKDSCYESNTKIVPDNLRANDGEIPIRQYQFAKLRTRASFMKARGRLQITNKRLIFRAPGRSLTGRTVLQNEFDVHEIHGISLQIGYRFSLYNFIIHGALFMFIIALFASLIISTESMILVGCMGFIFTFLGIGAFFMLPKCFPLKWILNGEATLLLATCMAETENIIIGILALIASILMIISVLIYCFLPDLSFNVDSSSGQSAVIIARERGGGLFGMFGQAGQSATGYREVMPDVDTTRAVREINAIISDLQTMGDLAVDKWKEE